MGSTLTTFDFALKEYYTDKEVQNLVYKNRPFLAAVSKMTTFGGDVLPVPVIYGNPQGRSASFSRAQTRAASSQTTGAKFLMTRVSDYGVVNIGREVMLASESDKGSFLKNRITEINGMMNSLSNSLSSGLYRSGYGKIGAISSFSTVTITLTTPEDSVNFEVGMELVVSASESSNTLRALGSSGNGLIITGVNRIDGTLTFGYNVDDATNGIPAIANADSLFVRGDRQDSGTPSLLKVAGLESWLPSSAPSSSPFFGVDRTADATRLGGLRWNGASQPIEEALIDALRLGGREGADIDTIYISFDKYADLEKSLGSKVQYIDIKVADVSFRGIRINGPKGEVKIVPDKDCPVNRAFGLQSDTWTLGSLKEAPHVFNDDGLQMLRQSSADGYEVRFGYYGNLWCSAPGYNINIQL